MESWDATGQLRALWGSVGGRDALADLTGILPTTLSSYNSGKRRLGFRHGELIAGALGVTVQDLGAPERDEAVLRRLIRAEVWEMMRDDPEFQEMLRQMVAPPRPVNRPRSPGGSVVPFASGG